MTQWHAVARGRGDTIGLAGNDTLLRLRTVGYRYILLFILLMVQVYRTRISLTATRTGVEASDLWWTYLSLSGQLPMHES